MVKNQNFQLTDLLLALALLGVLLLTSTGHFPGM
jgi:hypothetical protein